MAINLIKINGEHSKLNYKRLESSFKEKFSHTCSSASIFVLNRFPILVTADSDIDFVLIIAIEDIQGNYIYFTKNDRKVYLHNLIIPVKYVSDYKDEDIEIEGDSLLAAESEINYDKEITSLTYGFKNYLKNRCGINEEVYIHPLVFIEGASSVCVENHLVSDAFDFKAISLWLSKNRQEVLISNSKWKEQYGYENLASEINQIIEQASFDSELGYLTKKKIDRIGKDLNKEQDLIAHLSKQMIMIKGKAGSGKTSNLLSLSISALKNEFNSLLLTYNKILVYDLAQIVKPLLNSQGINQQASVDTLHGFNYRLSKSLGVLHVMSYERIGEILNNLKTRLRKSYDIIAPHIQFDTKSDFDRIKSLVQNSRQLDSPTKEVGIDFINFLSKRRINTRKALGKYSTEFYEWKEEKLTSIAAEEVFLSDYYGVLKNVLFQIDDPDKFYDDFDIKNKGNLIDLATGAGATYFNDDGVIEKKDFAKFKNRRVGGRKRNRIVFVDEAQDCHVYEKEILAKIFGTDRLVIANGGKEQLIRHQELCNWEVIRGKKISSIIKNKRNKSYRIKPQIAHFCNFLASEFGIDLNLESTETQDSGEIIFDFRSKQSNIETNEIFNFLNEKGEINGCKEYESILILLESLQHEGKDPIDAEEKVTINEYGNIVVTKEYGRGEWSKKKILEGSGHQFFDGTVADKTKLGLPYPNQFRLIYYESCRGLEAWTVACFDLDKFFNNKTEEDDAEKFLIDTEKDHFSQSMFVSNEQRKKMFAATWVLMALTRAIDTLYITIDDENSELGRVVKRYTNQNSRNIKVYS